jgi:threonine aldolase
MIFASDNWAGPTPEVAAALARHGAGFAPAYGGDEITKAVKRRFNEVFEREVEVFFTATGTASNALSMAAVAKPGGLILCSNDAHLRLDEYGAAEFFSGGMKPVAVPSRFGRMAPADLAETLSRYPEGNRTGRPVVLSLTNATEAGTVYTPAEIGILTKYVKRIGTKVHLDGARFANAVAATGATPAELTWKAGIDLMSFGGTKNGCWAAEAIVVFEPGMFPDLEIIKSRAGQTLSKSRFEAAQFEAYLEDDNWLRTAAHANAMAQRLADGFAARARLGWTPQANEVFPVLPKALAGRLRAAGAVFHPWSADEIAIGADEELCRFVTSWATTAEEVDRFLGLLAE